MRNQPADIPSHLWRNRSRNHQAPRERSPINIVLVLRVFVFLGGSSFLLGAVGYFMLWWVMPDGGVFGALFRMFLYHWAHPLQYIALMSLCYTLVACLVILSPNNPVGRRPRLVIPFIMAASIIVASPAGGVLWVFHDMQAGYFPEGRRFWEAIRWGAVEGIRSGWLIILSSIPYNILGVVAGYWVTWGGYTMAHPALERH